MEEGRGRGVEVTLDVYPYTATSSGFTSCLPGWAFEETHERLDAQRTRRTQTYTDPKTGLEVRCVRVLYADSPTVEWTVYLRNGGSTDTPLIEALQALCDEE